MIPSSANSAIRSRILCNSSGGRNPQPRVSSTTRNCHSRRIGGLQRPDVRCCELPTTRFRSTASRGQDLLQGWPIRRSNEPETTVLWPSHNSQAATLSAARWIRLLDRVGEQHSSTSEPATMWNSRGSRPAWAHRSVTRATGMTEAAAYAVSHFIEQPREHRWLRTAIGSEPFGCVQYTGRGGLRRAPALVAGPARARAVEVGLGGGLHGSR